MVEKRAAHFSLSVVLVCSVTVDVLILLKNA